MHGMARIMDLIWRRKPQKTDDEKLDEALENTFPASDPPAMTDPSVRIGERKTVEGTRR